MDELENWKMVLGAVAAVAAIHVCAFGFGSMIAREQSHILPLRIAVGTNVCALIGLWISWIPQPWPVCLLFVGALIAWCWLRLPSILTSRWTKVVRPTIFGVVSILGVLVTAGPAFTYPSGWDELMYHITLPMRWSDAGNISVTKDLPYSGLPSLAEILFWLVSPIERFIAPRAVSWSMWLIGLWLWYETLRLDVRNRASICWTWVVGASPTMLMICENCYVESFVWMNTAGLLYMLRNLEKGGEALRVRIGVLLGLMIGGAVATKLTAVGLLLLPVILMPVSSDRRSVTWDFVERLKFGAVVGGIALLFALSFYLRTWIQTENPFFPYLEHWFTSDVGRLEMSAYHHDLASGNFGVAGAIGWLVAPLGLSFAHEVYDGSFGFQWLGVLAFAVPILLVRSTFTLRWPERSRIVASVVLFVIWSASAQQARFAVPMVALLTHAVAMYVEKLSTSLRKWCLVCLFTLSLFSMPWTNAGYYLESWLCVIGKWTPEQYVREGTSEGYTDLVRFLKSKVDRNERVLSLFEHRLAYFPASTRIGTPYFQAQYFSPVEEYATPASIMQHLETHHVRWIVLSTVIQGPDTSQEWVSQQQAWTRVLDSCISRGDLKIEWSSHEYVVLSRIVQQNSRDVLGGFVGFSGTQRNFKWK